MLRPRGQRQHHAGHMVEHQVQAAGGHVFERPHRALILVAQAAEKGQRGGLVGHGT